MLSIKIADHNGRPLFLNLDGYTEATFDDFEGEPTLDITIGRRDFRLTGADALAALAILNDDANTTALLGAPAVEPDRPDDWERTVAFRGRPVEVEVAIDRDDRPARPLFPATADVPAEPRIPGGDEEGYPEGDDRLAKGFLRSFLRDRPADALAVAFAAGKAGISASALAAGRRLLGAAIREEAGVLSLVDPVRDAAASVVAEFAREDSDQLTHRHTCHTCCQQWTTSTARDRVRDDCPFCHGLNTRKALVAAEPAGRAS